MMRAALLNSLGTLNTSPACPLVQSLYSSVYCIDYRILLNIVIVIKLKDLSILNFVNLLNEFCRTMEDNGTNGDINTDSDQSPLSVKESSIQPLSTARKVIQLKIDNPLLTNGINCMTKAFETD